MSDDAKRFRDRARDCRNIAIGTKYEVDRQMLEDMAAELESEADQIDAEAEEARSLKGPSD
jgi:hypothetical protein